MYHQLVSFRFVATCEISQILQCLYLRAKNLCHYSVCAALSDCLWYLPKVRWNDNKTDNKIPLNHFLHQCVISAAFDVLCIAWILLYWSGLMLQSIYIMASTIVLHHW